MTLRNLPTERASTLRDLITCRPGQVSSMSLTSFDSACNVSLFAFSAGEAVSEETYGCDMLYIAVEGCFHVVLPDARISVAEGQAYGVAAGISHAIEGSSPFKMLQISIG